MLKVAADNGSQETCPCDNVSEFGGCTNSSGLGAALLLGGTTSISADDLDFLVVQAAANQTCVVFSGDNIHRRPLGDGIRCAGDNAIRLVMGTTDNAGNFATGPGLIALENGGLSAILTNKKPEGLAGGGYYLIDPLGNLVMYFAPDIVPGDMVDDIKRLLKLSRIG